MSHMTDESQHGGARPTFHNLPAAKRQRIVRAALAEFARGDYRQANLDRIATRARVPKGSLYQYFDGKAGLFTFVARTGLDEALRRFRAFLGAARPSGVWDVLYHAFTFLPRLHDERPDLATLYLRVGFLAGSDTRDAALPHLEQIGRAFTTALVDQGIAEGAIRRDVDREAAAWLIDAATQEFHRATLLPGGALAGATRRRQARLAREVVDLLKRSLT